MASRGELRAAAAALHGLCRRGRLLLDGLLLDGPGRNLQSAAAGGTRHLLAGELVVGCKLLAALTGDWDRHFLFNE